MDESVDKRTTSNYLDKNNEEKELFNTLNTVKHSFINELLASEPQTKMLKVEGMSVKNLDVFKFIAAVKAERFLYDKNNTEYRNADRRQQVWNEIAVQFNFADGKEAYKKWKYFKDHFFAEKKKMSQRGVDDNDGDYKKWQFYDALKWTEKYLDKRKSRGSVTDEQMEEPSPSITPTSTNLISSIDEVGRLENVLNNCKQPETCMTTAFQNLNHPSSSTDRKLTIDEKDMEMEAILFRPFENSVTSITANGTFSSISSIPSTTQQQYQQLHQALIAQTEEELFGRLVARDLVRLPENLRPLARLKIQELLCHFSTGHIPEMS